MTIDGTVKDTIEVSASGNAALADRLESFAALLELADAQYHAVRAYRRAAEVIRSTPAPVAELVRAGRAQELRGRWKQALERAKGWELRSSGP